MKSRNVSGTSNFLDALLDPDNDNLEDLFSDDWLNEDIHVEPNTPPETNIDFPELLQVIHPLEQDSFSNRDREKAPNEKGEKIAVTSQEWKEKNEELTAPKRKSTALLRESSQSNESSKTVTKRQKIIMDSIPSALSTNSLFTRPDTVPLVIKKTKSPRKLQYRWDCNDNIAIVKPHKGTLKATKINLQRRLESMNFRGEESDLCEYIDTACLNAENKLVVFLKQKLPLNLTLENMLFELSFDLLKRDKTIHQDFRKALRDVCKSNSVCCPMFYIYARLLSDQRKVEFFSEVFNPEETRIIIKRNIKLSSIRYHLDYLNLLTLNDPKEDGPVTAAITLPLPEGKTLLDCLNILKIKVIDERPVETPSPTINRSSAFC